MAKVDERAHAKLAQALADSRVSPAIMARHMLQENTYVNESLIQYMTNYVIMFANLNLVPMHLQEIHKICVALLDSLTELGLTGNARLPVDNTEYLAV